MKNYGAVTDPKDITTKEYVDGVLSAKANTNGNYPDLSVGNSSKFDGILSDEFVKKHSQNNLYDKLQFLNQTETALSISPNSGMSNCGTDGFVAYPSGGQLITTGSPSGYLKITLPHSWSDTMISFSVNIYNYVTSSSCAYTVYGYNYPTSSAWLNCTAYSYGGDLTKSNLPVRFGHDGEKCALYIGEASTVWDYPQCSVANVTVGFRGWSYGDWSKGWNISVTPTLGTITATVTNPNPLHFKVDKSSLSTVATSGNYVDLSNKPTSLPANGGTATAASQFLESDTRSTNQPPSWYMANYSSRNVYEFKQNSVIGLSTQHSEVPDFSEVSTFVSWADPSGGFPVQLATNDAGLYYRTSASNTSWNSWKRVADTSTPSGNSTIVSPSRPSSQNVGDTWYRVV